MNDLYLKIKLYSTIKIIHRDNFFKKLAKNPKICVLLFGVGPDGVGAFGQKFYTDKE